MRALALSCCAEGSENPLVSSSNCCPPQQPLRHVAALCGSSIGSHALSQFRLQRGASFTACLITCKPIDLLPRSPSHLHHRFQISLIRHFHFRHYFAFIIRTLRNTTIMAENPTENPIVFFDIALGGKLRFC